MNVYKYLRKREKLTQEELAKKLHLNQTTLSKWEKDKSIPDIETLIKLANFYNCSIDYLVGRKNFEQEKKTEQVEPTIEEFLTEAQKECIELIKQLTEGQALKLSGYIERMIDDTKQSQNKILN